MRIAALLTFIVVLSAGAALASTIDLNDGRTVQGTIIQQDAKSVQVSVDGVTMTYYADEIKDIDGQPFSAVPAATVAAAPAADTGPADVSAIDPEKKALILKFIDVFGTRQALNSNFETMIEQIAKTKPDQAEKIRDRVKIDELIDRMLPVYDQHFTTDDLKAYIAFYDSPQGQKLINSLPDLMRESVQVSIKYMQDKFPEAKNEST